MQYTDKELLDMAYRMLRLARDGYGCKFLEDNETMRTIAERVDVDVEAREHPNVLAIVRRSVPLNG